MCEKCKVYLYDYFQQPLDKENPLYPFVNQKQIQQKLSELIPLAYHLLFKTMTFNRFLQAESDVDNYCNFIKKVENPYQKFEMIYMSLQRDKNFLNEIKQIEGYLLDLHFLRVQKTDNKAQVLHRWLAFFFGSLFCDMSVLHRQHSEKNIWSIDLEKGHPGRPDTAVKKPVKPQTILIKIDDDDELYT